MGTHVGAVQRPCTNRPLFFQVTDNEDKDNSNNENSKNSNSNNDNSNTRDNDIGDNINKDNEDDKVPSTV